MIILYTICVVLIISTGMYFSYQIGYINAERKYKSKTREDIDKELEIMIAKEQWKEQYLKKT